MRPLVPALLAGALLILVTTPPAEAQRGLGGQGRGQRQPDQSSSSGPAEYSFAPPRVLEAINRGEGAQALESYERAAQGFEQQGNRLGAGRAWHAVAMVAIRLGRYQTAIRSATRSVDAYKQLTRLAPFDQANLASSYSHLGAGYRLVGDLPRARQVLEEGLAYVRGNLGGRRAGQSEGFLLNGLAQVAMAQRDYQSALAWSTQAAQFFEDAESRINPGAGEDYRANVRRWLAGSYAGIGHAEKVLGEAEKADAAFAQGLRYARLSGLHEMEVILLAAQGDLALSRQEWPKALTAYQEGVKLAGQIGRTGSLPFLYHGQARALAGLGRRDEALASSREAVRYVEEVRADLGDSGIRSGYFESKQTIYHFAVYLALQAQHPEEAFSLAEQARSRTFLDLLGSQTALSKGRTRALVDEETRLRARLAEAQARAQESAGLEGSERARDAATALDRDYRQFLERVRKESLEQASLMAVEPVTPAELQALLPEGTTLLEYFISDRGLAIWVVDRHQLKAVRVPGDRQSLVGQVRHFRAAITGLADVGDVRVQAERLYRRLLEPARAEIHGSRLVIVPHDVLHYLPFPALRSPEGRWLVEDFAVSTLPSASVLRYLSDKGAGAPPKTLVVGNPDLGAALALPWAEREARMVGQREPEATVLVRGDATEARVKQLLGSVGLVHLATHGQLSEEDPLSSAMLLVPGGGEDGRLEVREVFGLDLHARLVVLSACETGLGKLSSGDELVGLQRAFLYAGTPAVVTTLWKVDDRATFDLVRAFYAHLDRENPVDALRAAQIETLKAFPHPFSWAAFGLAGLPP